MSMLGELDVQRERAAKNQSLFREVNERIEGVAGSWRVTSFICECADDTCDKKCDLTVQDYEKIRSDPNSFFVLHGHEIPDVEQITHSTDRYLVVAKLGVGASVAEQLDPRGRTEPPDGKPR
jgi:hypothetical protein